MPTTMIRTVVSISGVASRLWMKGSPGARIKPEYLPVVLGTLILETLGEVLRERFGVARVVLLAKEHYSKPATDALIDQMAAQVDIAIAAVGG